MTITTIHKHNRNNDSGRKSNRKLLNMQVENKCYCMAIIQMLVVAFLGVKKPQGRSAKRSRRESPEKFLPRRGLIRSKGKMVISSMSNHSETDGNRTGLTRRRHGHWIHLNWSLEQKLTRVFLPGTYL